MSDAEPVEAEVEEVDIPDRRMHAIIDLIKAAGGRGFQIRFHDGGEPTVWMVLAEFKVRLGKKGSGKRTVYQVAAGLGPVEAAIRLAQQVVDGGTCRGCKKLAMVDLDWGAEPMLDEHLCWYLYDPELNVFRRSCEGDGK